MRSEVRTAIVLGGVIAVGLAVASIAFTALDSEPASTVAAGVDPDAPQSSQAVDKSRFKMAPDLVGIADYLNTTPEELEARIGDSVVLYDIWTYSCINCLRTLPYITAWDEKYADQGLLIIGVHSPEFEFEKDVDNVRRAVEKHGIEYPVVLDNDWETWDAFENRYWPRKYVADHEGYVRYDRIGEGGYQETERVIQKLLAERAAALGVQAAAAEPLVDIDEFQHTAFRTPELYFGYYFAQNRNNLGSSEGFNPGQTIEYERPGSVEHNKFYMVGTWTNGRDGMSLPDGEDGSVLLKYSAKEVNIVTAGAGVIRVLVDGAPISADIAGHDVDSDTGLITTDEPRLYNVVSAESSSTHEIELQIDNGGGFEMFTFTFG
ncbi:MAG: redoxin domain-containing protein [Thaumarchaeota archaeon]|nr:redoxin domain-containing protein [Nitrososphaerota archaeon]